ncbi:hypothetical protein LINPERHAP2_LOCUS39505, partial [Linum perenne]
PVSLCRYVFHPILHYPYTIPVGVVIPIPFFITFHWHIVFSFFFVFGEQENVCPSAAASHQSSFPSLLRRLFAGSRLQE